MSTNEYLDQTAPISTVLQRLRQNMFVTPYCSDGKDQNGQHGPMYQCPKSVAMTKVNVQINGPRRITYLSHDLDRPTAAYDWMDRPGAPVPNLIISNPTNGHAHLIYELADPIWLPKQGQRESTATRYMKTVRNALGRLLGADNGYSHVMVHNPFHALWDVRIAREQPYTLDELAAHLDLDQDYTAIEECEDADGRRNNLFQSGRYWAYRNLHRFNSQESLHQALTEELHQLNDSFAKGPETLATVRSTAKSISRYVWTRWECGLLNGKRRGIMSLDPSESLQVRQQQGQSYSSQLKVNKTLDKIRTAIASLQDQGLPVNKSVVSRMTGMTRMTVQNYWSVVMNDNEHSVNDDIVQPVPSNSNSDNLDPVPSVCLTVPSCSPGLVPSVCVTVTSLPLPVTEERETEAPAGPSHQEAPVRGRTLISTQLDNQLKPPRRHSRPIRRSHLSTKPRARRWQPLLR